MSVIILICLSNIAEKQDCKIIDWFRLLVKLFLNLSNTNKKFNCVMVLMIRPSSTLWQFFLFQWMSLSNLFPVKFLKFLAMSFGFGCSDFYHIWYLNRWLKIISNHPLSMNEKFDCNGHQIYSKTLTKICFCKKEETSLSFIRVIQNSSFDQSFIYIWSKPF